MTLHARVWCCLLWQLHLFWGFHMVLLKLNKILNDYTLSWWAGLTISAYLVVLVRVKWLCGALWLSSVENYLFLFVAVQLCTDRGCTCLLWCQDILSVGPSHQVLLTHAWYKKDCKNKKEKKNLLMPISISGSVVHIPLFSTWTFYVPTQGWKPALENSFKVCVLLQNVGTLSLACRVL